MKRNLTLGIGLKLAQTLFFSLMYAAIKLAGEAPVGEVIFFRSFFALIPLFLWTYYTVGPRAAIATKHPIYHIGRSAIGSIAMFFNFAAVQLLPLVTVTAFGFLQPIFVVIFSALLLHERIGIYRTAAVVIGFIGILMMIEPHGGLDALVHLQLSAGVGYALAFAVLTALVVILIRQMSATERSEAIVFYFMSWGAIIGAVAMLFQGISLEPATIMWLVICGLLGGGGQICMTYCYRYAEPSLLASFDYISMVWAMLLGFFVFGEMPEMMVLAGSLVVISAGLIIVWRARYLKTHPGAVATQTH